MLPFVHAIARLEITRDTRRDKARQDKTRQDKRQDLDKEKTAKPEGKSGALRNETVLPLGTKECCPTKKQTRQGSRHNKAADKARQQTKDVRRQDTAGERGSVQQCGVGGAKGRQIFERGRENFFKNIRDPHLHCYVQT